MSATAKTFPQPPICDHTPALYDGPLLGKGGLFDSVLRIKPPMCLTKDDASFLVECLDKSLSLARRGG